MNGVNKYGSEVRRLRSQAGLKQEDLGNRVMCSKQYISEIERGRSLPGVDLSHKLDQALGASGYLTTLLRDMKVPIDPGNTRSEIYIDGHLFYPAVVSSQDSDLSSLSFDRKITPTIHKSAISSDHRIYLYPFSVAVVHEHHRKSFSSLTEAARWRRHQIARRQKAAREHLASAVSGIRIVSQDPYCLSCLHVTGGPWTEWSQITRVVQLLSCPSLLDTTTPSDRDLNSSFDHEAKLINRAGDIQGCIPFGFEGRHTAWAAWSGVSVFFRDRFELDIHTITSFEVFLQAVWTLANHVDQTGEAPLPHFGLDFFKTLRRRLRNVSATEHISVRHMKEALIETSRIIEVIDNAIDALAK